MKHELEKITGPMIEETERVQERLRVAMQQPVKRSKVHWQYPVAVVLFIAFAAAFVWSQAQPRQTVTAEVEPLRDDIFEWYLYDAMYTQGKFVKREEAAFNSVYFLLHPTSMIAFAKAQDIKLSEKNIEKRLQEIKEPENELLQAKQQHLQETLHITNEQYENLLRFIATASVAEQKLVEQANIGAHDDGSIESAAYEYYMEHAGSEVETFYKEHNITNESHANYEIVSIPEELNFLSTLELGIGSSGELEFIDTDTAQQFIEDNYSDVLYEAAHNKKYPFEFGPIFYEQYKENVIKLASIEGKWQNKASELLQIFTILERSFIDDYPFLQKQGQ